MLKCPTTGERVGVAQERRGQSHRRQSAEGQRRAPRLEIVLRWRPSAGVLLRVAAGAGLLLRSCKFPCYLATAHALNLTANPVDPWLAPVLHTF